MKSIKKYVLDLIARIQYKRSFKRASKGLAIMNIAEEGMDDYFQQLKNY